MSFSLLPEGAAVTEIRVESRAMTTAPWAAHWMVLTSIHPKLAEWQAFKALGPLKFPLFEQVDGVVCRLICVSGMPQSSIRKHAGFDTLKASSACRRMKARVFPNALPDKLGPIEVQLDTKRVDGLEHGLWCPKCQEMI